MSGHLDSAALLAATRGEPTGGRLEVSGEPSAIAQFADLFGLPATAADLGAR